MVKIVFSAVDNTATNVGTELFVTDGTAAGTTLLKDINPGLGSSNPANFLVSGAQTYFTANDGTHGTEVWVTDGTAAGTLRLDALPAASPASYSSPTILSDFAGFYFFSATDNTATNAGTELFVTNGTAAGTSLLKDVNPGPASSNPVNAGYAAFFYMNDGAHGVELWVSGGTPATTTRLDPQSAANPATYKNPNSFLVVSGAGAAFFVATDNTAANTGTELYVTNGTAAGTSLLKDINPGAGNSTPANFVAAGANLFFTANDGSHGVEEWITNGTAAGTIRLDAAPAGSAASYANPTSLINLGANSVFVATDNTVANMGTELYVTNGTAAGTSLLKDINPGSGGSNPGNFIVSGAKAFFTANDGTHGTEEWVTDGTAAGTIRLDAAPAANPASYKNPTSFVSLGGTNGLFVATDNTAANTGTELYFTNGTAAGTTLVTDINPGAGSSNPSNFFALGGAAFFTANDGTHGVEEWFTNGTAAGTVRLDPLPAGSPASYTNPGLVYIVGGTAVFVATDNTATNLGTELYVTGATPATTGLLKDINPGSGSSNPSNFLVIGGLLYFTANDGTHGVEEWVTNGTAAGTVRLDALPAGSAASYTTPKVSANNTFSVAATDASKSDGGSAEIPFTFTVSRAGDDATAATVSYSVAGTGSSPAVAADFAGGTLPTGTVSFGAYDVSKTVTINVLPNGTSHPDQTFSVNLAPPVGQNAGQLDIAFATASATGTIISSNNPSPPPPGNFSVTDTTTSVTTQVAGVPYTGPVAGLQFQYINTTTDNLNVTTNVANTFVHTGSGFDAIDVSHAGGINVLDGGTNSNFLVGGTGAGSNDTFFVDDRGPSSDIWSTVANFHAGDAATIFGITKNGFATNFVDGQGAAGFTGLTLHVTAPGVPIASLTLTGYTSADLASGRVSTIYGTEADGTPYLYIHGNS